LPEIAPSPTETTQAIKRTLPAGEVDTLLQIGERLLREGDVAAARLSLRRAAEAGSAEAARDLGMSFDPSFVGRVGASAAPDLAQAAQWYRRAIELGLKDVSRNLERLAKMPNSPTR
jgi:TPR repeat protein